MNGFATKFAASTMVIAAAMVGCHSDSVVASASASTSERSMQQAGRLAEQAQAALRSGDSARALGLAERAVEMSPHDAGYRMLLADLYLKNGRFRSAETSYGDVLTIDPANVRAGLSTALVQLEQLTGTAPASDVGLALALAGQPQRAIELLEPAARGSDANGRTRQNLALAYALAGDWQRARTVAAQDVSPAELGQRMQQWAALAQPSASGSAVATLLGVTPVADPGQPVRLALAPPQAQPVAYAEAQAAPVPAPQPEVQVASASFEAPAEVPVQIAEAPAAEPVAAPVQEPIQYAEAPVVPAVEAAPAPAAAQPVQTAAWWPSPRAAAAEAQAPVDAEPATPEVRYAAAVRTLSAPSPALTRAPATVARAARPTFRPSPVVRAAAAITARIPRLGSGAGQFVVQLGAFANPANAERAWAQASSRFGIRDAEARTAQVTVGGRTLTRVSIAGFSSRADAVRVCSSIRERGGSCFVRATAGDSPVRWASAAPRSGRG
jgi:Flp pilus assembly protein TadD